MIISILWGPQAFLLQVHSFHGSIILWRLEVHCLSDFISPMFQYIHHGSLETYISDLLYLFAFSAPNLSMYLSLSGVVSDKAKSCIWSFPWEILNHWELLSKHEGHILNQILAKKKKFAFNGLFPNVFLILSFSWEAQINWFFQHGKLLDFWKFLLFKFLLIKSATSYFTMLQSTANNNQGITNTSFFTFS